MTSEQHGAIHLGQAHYASAVENAGAMAGNIAGDYNRVVGVEVHYMGSPGQFDEKLDEILSKCKKFCTRRKNDTASVASSVWTTYKDDDQNVWRALRRELCNDGVRSDDISKYSSKLKAYISELRREERLGHEDEALHGSSPTTSTEFTEDFHETVNLNWSRQHGQSSVAYTSATIATRPPSPAETLVDLPSPKKQPTSPLNGAYSPQPKTPRWTPHPSTHPDSHDNPFHPSFVHMPREPNFAQMPEDPKFAHIPQDSNFVHIPQDPNSFQMPQVPNPYQFYHVPYPVFQPPYVSPPVPRPEQVPQSENPIIPLLTWQILPKSELHPLKEIPALPEGWDWRIDDQNQLFYVDTYARGKEKRCFWHPPEEEEDHDDVPGWKKICTIFGRVYWVHHKSKIVSYEYPRNAPQLRCKSSGELSIWFLDSWRDWGSINLIKFRLDDSHVACQLSKSVWRKGLSKRAVTLRGDLWWGNPSVKEQNLKRTRTENISYVFLHEDDEISSEDEAASDTASEENSPSIPFTWEREPGRRNSPERPASMAHPLPNNYVRPYVEDASDHDDDVAESKMLNVSTYYCTFDQNYVRPYVEDASDGEDFVDATTPNVSSYYYIFNESESGHSETILNPE